MRCKGLIPAVIAIAPTVTLAAGSIALTSGGLGLVLTLPNTPISVPIEVNLNITTPFGTWDAAIVCNRPGYYLDNRAVNSPFSGYWNLDFGAWNTSHQSLDNQAISIGYLKPSAGDITFSGIAETFTLTGPGGLRPMGDVPVYLSLVAPDGSGLFYKGAANSGPQSFNVIGNLLLGYIPEPASLMLLGLSTLLLKTNRGRQDSCLLTLQYRSIHP